MSNKTKVTYTPDFDYKKSYDTIGNKRLYATDLQDSNTIETADISNLITKDDILSEMISVRNLYFVLPSEVVSILHTMTLGITQSLPYIKDTELPLRQPVEDSDKPSDDILNNNNVSSSIDDSPNSDSSLHLPQKPTINEPNLPLSSYPNKNRKNRYDKYKDPSGQIVTKIGNKTISLPSGILDKNKFVSNDIKIQENDYDLVDAFDYTMLLVYDQFLNKVHDAINYYNLNLASGASYGNIHSLSDEHNIDINSVDDNLKHLADNITRSNIIYDQKIRLANKMYTLINCINHFNAIYTSKEFYNRYKSESYQPNNDIKSNFINTSLSATKSSYYSKYISNLTNIYKYYNSCAVILSECLNTKAQSFVSKNIIG